MTKIPGLKRVYIENEYIREGRNGRIYTGTIGWRWFPIHDAGIVEWSDPEGYKTRKEAKLAGLKLLNPPAQNSAGR